MIYDLNKFLLLISLSLNDSIKYTYRKRNSSKKTKDRTFIEAPFNYYIP